MIKPGLNVTPAIVLAAGASSRMGRPKANLALEDGDTFLSRIVKTFRRAGIEDVVVVVGFEADSIVETFARTGEVARLIENPDPASGQASSLVRGLNAIDRPGVAAALVTLVDVPLVSVETVRAVVDRYRQTRAPVCTAGPRRRARPSRDHRSDVIRSDSAGRSKSRRQTGAARARVG